MLGVRGPDPEPRGRAVAGIRVRWVGMTEDERKRVETEILERMRAIKARIDESVRDRPRISRADDPADAERTLAAPKRLNHAPAAQRSAASDVVVDREEMRLIVARFLASHKNGRQIKEEVLAALRREMS